MSAKTAAVTVAKFMTVLAGQDPSALVVVLDRETRTNVEFSLHPYQAQGGELDGQQFLIIAIGNEGNAH